MQSGTLKEVKGDFILVDAKWYKVLEPKYVPKGQDVAVEFETTPEDASVIKFIKRAGAVVGKSKGSGAGSASNSSSNGSRDRSIVRQVLFKGAVELVNGGKYPNVSTALEDLKKNEDYLMG